eukprot:14898316-Ditylum_brightwellii.AAC.1
MLANTLQQINPPSPQRLLEVFVDKFIAAINDTTTTNVQIMSCAMLHSIHCIFPPPDVTGHGGADPVSEKKLGKGDGQ